MDWQNDHLQSRYGNDLPALAQQYYDQLAVGMSLQVMAGLVIAGVITMWIVTIRTALKHRKAAK